MRPVRKYASAFGIGGVRVQMQGAADGDVALVPLLEPFRIPVGECDVAISVRWVRGISQTQGRRAFDSGTTWSLFEDDSEFAFDFHSPSRQPHLFQRLLIDKQFRDARLEMSRAYFEDFPGVPVPASYPLDELLIMHRLTQEKAIELHGCGIVRADGIGNLFVGHSGAGKSTTTRLWTATEDVEVLSDDRIILRRDDNAQQVPHRRFAPVRNDNPKYKIRMYGTPWHGEAMYASPNSAPLARIFVLEHGVGNVVTPLSPSQAVAELFARSFVPFHRHEYVDSALQFLQEVVDAVPVYHYSFEPDQRAVDTILNLRD